MAQGHVYRRTLQGGRPSKWYAVLDVPSPGGRKQVTKSFPSRKEAQLWLASMTVTRTEPKGTPLAEYLPRWLAGKAGVKASTKASYRMHVERYLVPMVGHLEVQRLTPHDIQSWHRDLLEAGIDPASIARIHATLSSALGTAKRQGLLQRNPLAGVELPRRRPYRRSVWTDEEASVFLSSVRGDALEGLWRLALLGGLRRGELLGLRWRDLDLKRGTLLVESTRLRLGGDIIEDGPKTVASHRLVHLDPVTVTVLRRSQAPSTGGADRHVFTDRDGYPLDPAALSRRFHELRQRLDLPRIRMHDLRHTSATLGLASGESLKEVSARLGHAAISVTADLYTEVTPGLARASAQRLAASLDKHRPSAIDGEVA